MNFLEFIANYGVIGLSISTALGLAFHSVVQNITNEIILPFIGILFGIKKFKDLTWTYMGQIINVGLILKSILGYLINFGIIVLFGLVFFRDISKQVHNIKKQNELDILDEQKQTKSLLQELVELEKNRDDRIYGKKGKSYI